MPSRHRSACDFYFYHGFDGKCGYMSCGGRYRSKSLLLSPGLRPCSLMRMLSHVSVLPCLTIHIRLVCPLADRKSTKQNSCPWQYKMSLHRRLLTVTLDLRGACPIAFSLFYHGWDVAKLIERLNLLQRAIQKPQKPLGEDGGLSPCCYTSALVL